MYEKGCRKRIQSEYRIGKVESGLFARAGLMFAQDINKKSRKTLLLSQKLRDELEEYFQWTTRINNSDRSTIRKEKVNRPNLNGALQDERY